LCDLFDLRGLFLGEGAEVLLGGGVLEEGGAQGQENEAGRAGELGADEVAGFVGLPVAFGD
jgi:hypothetical protein